MFLRQVYRDVSEIIGQFHIGPLAQLCFSNTTTCCEEQTVPKDTHSPERVKMRGKGQQTV
jgi:hypothetical protein